MLHAGQSARVQPRLSDWTNGQVCYEWLNASHAERLAIFNWERGVAGSVVSTSPYTPVLSKACSFCQFTTKNGHECLVIFLFNAFLASITYCLNILFNFVSGFLVILIRNTDNEREKPSHR